MNILPVAADAPWYLKAGADALLALHIGGGTLGMISGTAALFARKGSKAHAMAGTVFFVSMLCVATVGATVSPFLPTGPLHELPNAIAGVMTFYLVATGWLTVKRKGGHIGGFEKGAFWVALTVFAMGIVFIAAALNSPTGTVGNTPPEAFFVFTLVGGIAAASDLRVILKGGIAGAPRIARHLWRMCTALTIAMGSFFLGQPKFVPAFLHGTSLIFVPVLVPLLMMAYWLLRVRLGPRFRARAAA
ncbi:MAG TPA: DUF2306 domain-containing protein [Rhizomicrobium sp.]|jgi:hypothetical protein